MKESTLGLIETYGFVGAVEALDSAAKAADIKLVDCEYVRGGIVTVLITGDVSAVKAAVEISAASVEKLGVLRNTHVIARACSEVLEMVHSSTVKSFKEESPIKITTEDEKKELVNLHNNKKKSSISTIKVFKTKEELEAAKVTELRTMARKMGIKSLTKKQIKYGRKEQLIDAILAEINRR